MRRWDAERDPGGLDLSLRSDEPLGHGLLGNEEGAGDRLRSEPAERSQCERDLALEGESRMAAREDELEPLVRDRFLFHLVLPGRYLEQARLRGERAVAADAVDRAVSRRSHQPGARVLRRPVARPAFGCRGEGLLGGFLGEVEVAEEADQTGEDTAPLFAEDPVEYGYCSLSGRTSTAPPMRAAGIRDASSIAASRSSASKNR